MVSTSIISAGSKLSQLLSGFQPTLSLVFAPLTTPNVSLSLATALGISLIRENTVASNGPRLEIDCGTARAFLTLLRRAPLLQPRAQTHQILLTRAAAHSHGAQ